MQNTRPPPPAAMSAHIHQLRLGLCGLIHEMVITDSPGRYGELKQERDKLSGRIKHLVQAHRD